MLRIICGYLVLINLLAFSFYGADKSKARRGAWRIPEKVLLGLAFAGGGTGSLLGMLVFHHKTKKWKFRILVPMFIIFHISVLLVCMSYAHPADQEAFKALSNKSETGDTTGSQKVYVHYETNNLLLFEPEEPKAGLIFYPGGLVQFEAYAPLLRKCAEQGIVCALVRMPLNLAVLNKRAAKGIAKEYPLIEDWYLAGHSLGGAMAADYLASHTAEYRGLILLGAYSVADLSETDLRVLSIYGSEDGILNKDNYEKNKNNLPADAREEIIEGGCHAGFGYYGKQAGDGTPAISTEEQVEITADLIAGFINEK